MRTVVISFFVVVLFFAEGRSQNRSLGVTRPRLVSAKKPFHQIRTVPSIPVLNPQSGGKAGNPGLVLRISPKGLNYANTVAGNILNNEIRTVNIPDISQNIKKGRVEAKNVRITEFQPPTYRVNLNSPNRIGWTTSGGKISIKGNWKGKRKVLFFTIRGSGSFTASASNIRISLAANFRKNSQG